MREQLYKYLRMFEALNKREKALLMVIILFLVWAIWDSLFIRPMSKALPSRTQKLEELRAEVTGYKQVLSNLDEERKRKGDPAAQAREKIASTEGDIKKLRGELDQLTTAGIINSAQMSRALADLLALKRGLRLVSLKNIEPRPIMESVPAGSLLGESLNAAVNQAVDSVKQAAGVQSAQIYRHSVEMELSGSYLDLLNYVRALETLPWRLFWDEIEVHMDSYPNARIRLVLSTLSLEAGLIGA